MDGREGTNGGRMPWGWRSWRGVRFFLGEKKMLKSPALLLPVPSMIMMRTIFISAFMVVLNRAEEILMNKFSRIYTSVQRLHGDDLLLKHRRTSTRQCRESIEKRKAGWRRWIMKLPRHQWTVAKLITWSAIWRDAWVEDKGGEGSSTYSSHSYSIGNLEIHHFIMITWTTDATEDGWLNLSRRWRGK